MANHPHATQGTEFAQACCGVALHVRDTLLHVNTPSPKSPSFQFQLNHSSSEAHPAVSSWRLPCSFKPAIGARVCDRVHDRGLPCRPKTGFARWAILCDDLQHLPSCQLAFYDFALRRIWSRDESIHHLMLKDIDIGRH